MGCTKCSCSADMFTSGIMGRHTIMPSFNISLGRVISCQHAAFSGVGAVVASFVPAECPKGGGMWGIFGKLLKGAIWNTQVCMLY